MGETSDIREILFDEAEEFLTTDIDQIAKIDRKIDRTKSQVSDDLGSDYDLGVALLTAHNMSLSKIELSGYSGKILSEQIGDEKVTYQNGSSSNDSYSFSSYGQRYKALIKLYYCFGGTTV